MKILLFDDHRIFGESLSKLLEDWDEISICRYVSNETEFWNILSYRASYSARAARRSARAAPL